MFRRKLCKKVSIRVVLIFSIILTISNASHVEFNPLKSLGIAHASPAGLYPLNITVNPGANYERIILATHGGTLADGNWIELTQGIQIDIPSTSFEYSGVSTVEFTVGSNTINVTQEFDASPVTYPLTTHQVYLPGMSINATFWGNTALAGDDVNFTMLRVSSLMNYRQIFNDTLRGDLANLRDNLTNPYRSSTQTLDSNGDASWVISPDPGAGDYILLITKEIGATTPYDLYIYSMTIVQVLDYSCTITASSSVQKGNALDVDITLGAGASGTFRYGAFLIKQSAYTSQLKLSYDGTKLGTNLTMNGVLIANGSLIDALALGTQDLAYFSPAQITGIIASGFGSNRVSVGITSSTSSTVGSTSLVTSNLQTGTYILLAGAWDNNDYFVAFNQSAISVTSPPRARAPPPPPPPPSNQIPVADAGPNQTALMGRTIYFSGSGSNDPDGSISTYVWVFGDGNSQIKMNASHIYTEEGEYTVELTVIDNLSATGTDTANILVISLPAEPETGTDEGVDPGSIGHIVNATEEAGTTVTLNTTDYVSVSILKYTENPYPEVPTPPNSLPTIIDIFVSNQDAITWPIHVERHYTDSDIEGLDESMLALYYYSDGAWHICRETGVYPELNIVWANMYGDEVTGSLTLVAQRPSTAEFQVSQLEISPSTVEPGDPVTITVKVTNVGADAGDFNVTLNIDGIPEETQQVSLEGLASVQVSFTVSEVTEGEYIVNVDGLSGDFIVRIPLPAEFQVSDLTLTPEEVEPGDLVTLDIVITNIGEERGSYNFDIKVDGQVVDSISGSLTGGENILESTIISSETEGSHTVEIDGLTDTFDVISLPMPVEFEVSDLQLSETAVEPGQEIEGSVLITNIGDISGIYTLAVTLDDSLIYKETVSLIGGQSERKTFDISSDEPGSHTIEVAGSTADFTVTTPPAIIWIWIDLIIIVVAIGVIYYLRKVKII